MRIDFYHLGAPPVEQVAPSLCEKVLEAGGRLLLIAEPGLLERLDEKLWTWRADSFLPHGRDDPGAQPILLSEEMAAANGAKTAMIADGRWRDEALAFARILYLFDSSALDEARSAWRGLKGREGAELHYWKQSGTGGWAEGP